MGVKSGCWEVMAAAVVVVAVVAAAVVVGLGLVELMDSHVCAAELWLANIPV